MSLFTVIKYGHTRIGKLGDLQDLPVDILEKFYERLHSEGGFQTKGSDNDPLMKCAVIMNIYNKWYVPSIDRNIEEIFKKVLMEHEE